jgi:hypothetical protein
MPRRRAPQSHPATATTATTAATAFERLEPRRLLSIGAAGQFSLDQTWGSGGFVDVPRDMQAVTSVLALAGAADGSVFAIPGGSLREVIAYRPDG